MSAQPAPELKGNWEDRPRTGSVWWPKYPEERVCPMCRQSLLHTEAEHEALYPAAYEAKRKEDADKERAQADRDAAYIQKLVAKGMTEDQAVDYWLARINDGADV